MRVIVIGLGSMGRRRIRLIRQYDPMIEICGIDTSEERRKQAESACDIRTSDSMENVRECEYDCAFVCTSPLSHSDLIRTCLNLHMHVFTELNLVSDGYEENIRLAKEHGKVLFLSSTFLYREEIGYIDRMVRESGGAVSYQYHVGQYLPDWHPWENYRDYFVGDKRTNGCRELFAIELPWLLHIFGAVRRMYVVKGKNTELQIDYPDSYQVLLEHANGAHGSLAVDVVSRKAVRNLEVFSEKLYLSWNGTPESLRYYDYERKEEIAVSLYDRVEHREGYDRFIIENSYLHEIEAFFAQIKDGTVPAYDFEQDKKTLALIDRIEE
ncbi:MAG: Gfo/Idh/MocA family oxidoreductase [bacterium]|nr:Gfo/Idh/MocA family oxidoreductase [bacterium]MCM1422593.1 Gfo/Idh/MocA family oxidoreductase [bacterium]